MKQLFFSICLLIGHTTYAQDTFSLVATDEESGQVGSAGATCLDRNDILLGAKIISDVLPGKGAIHTQSFYIPANQNNARTRMEAGDSPQEITEWLENNDAQGNSTQRQYGIVDFDDDGKSRAAAFTGTNCFDEKNHRVGSNYAIQGNILISEDVLDSMEARFLRETGSLADRLMAAMQGANIAGADSRCLSEGVSSKSAFIVVANPDDSESDLYLDINVNETGFGEEPIDELQRRYDTWLTTGTDNIIREDQISIYPNPVSEELTIEWKKNEFLPRFVKIIDATGVMVKSFQWQGPIMQLNVSDFKTGNYFLLFSDSEDHKIGVKKFIVNN